MKKNILLACLLISGLTACNNKTETKMGSYAYDAQFLQDHGIQYLELKSNDGESKIMVSPEWQGRVLTSSAAGDHGDSYGWINYKFINSGEKSKQFNPIGGEERFWLGPEGGPYSLYFGKDKEQVYENWKVPAVIDTEAYKVVNQSDTAVTFEKRTSVKNASGTVFDIDIERKVSLLQRAAIEKKLSVTIPIKLPIQAKNHGSKRKDWYLFGCLVILIRLRRQPFLFLIIKMHKVKSSMMNTLERYRLTD